MARKVVYVVRGSHDGKIGVYTNVKRAWEVAVDYATGGGNELDRGVNYREACKQLDKKRYNHSIFGVTTDDFSTYADIEMFNLNDVDN